MRLFSVMILVVIAGCTSSVPVAWVATGGSRADGTVVLAYEYGRNQVPEVDKAAGATLAADRCGVWGYTGAAPFGGELRQCTMMDMFWGGCAIWRVTTEYQCTGDGADIGR